MGNAIDAMNGALEALEHAKQVIRTWHDIDTKGQESLWLIYQQSPEMKMINEAIPALRLAIAEVRKQPSELDEERAVEVMAGAAFMGPTWLEKYVMQSAYRALTQIAIITQKDEGV